MTGPGPGSNDGARTRNEVGENSGYAVQTGQALGDVNAAPTGAATSAPTRTNVPADTTQARKARLQRKTGVDVDGADIEAKRTEGASDKTDLYLDEFQPHVRQRRRLLRGPKP